MLAGSRTPTASSRYPGLARTNCRQPHVGAPQPWETVDRAQAARGGATGPEPPAPPVCPECGLTGERRSTYTGQHVLLEPRLIVPTHLVPGGHRWHLDIRRSAQSGGPPALVWGGDRRFGWCGAGVGALSSVCAWHWQVRGPHGW
ncbi:DUF6083 domain-containing protein, partial [Streptomyces sp. NPDC020800]|uniref:DUF6083 domain-containing protein n=1 Tax=Streptomyces sp. NPDC020800 TaxID=3365092 RepID=UPI0037A6709D